MTLLMISRRMGRGDLTAYGFRSKFRGWGAVTTSSPSESPNSPYPIQSGRPSSWLIDGIEVFPQRLCLTNDGALMRLTTQLALLVFAAACLPARADDEPQGALEADEPMRFEVAGNGGNCSFCVWTAAEGTIVDGTPDAFQRFLENGRITGPITFNSPGGDLLAGIELGRMIREAGLDTAVGRTLFRVSGRFDQRVAGGTCDSACAYAFLGGLRRTADPEALGFHQFYRTSDSTRDAAEIFASETGLSIDQLIQGLVVAYVADMGVDARLVTAASMASGSEILTLTQHDIYELNVLTRPHVDGEWFVEPWSAGAVAMIERTYPERPSDYLSLFCREEQAGATLMVTRSILEDRQISAENLHNAIGGVTLYSGGNERALTNFEGTDSSDQSMVRMSDDVIYLTIDINSSNLTWMLSSESIGIQFDVPSVYRDINPFTQSSAVLLNERGRQIVELVLGNCI